MAHVKDSLDELAVEHLAVRRDGAVVTVTMNRPQRRNALHPAAHRPTPVSANHRGADHGR